MVLQLLLGGIAGAFLVVKMYWRRFLCRFKGKSSDSSSSDSFSTLFAVKFPAGHGHYNTTTSPIEDLLAETLFSDVEMLKQTVEKESEPFVYLKKKWEFEKFPYINGVH